MGTPRRQAPFFRDRTHAGRVLAGLLGQHAGAPELLVLALPRGGVPVGFEVARALRAPLDIWAVRKLGLPGHEEYAMGAIASGGVRVMNPLPALQVPPQALAQVLAREEAELARREHSYRGSRPAVRVAGRHVILVDDGLATGATLQAAALAVRSQHPARLTIAVPVGAPDSCERLREVADEVVCAHTPQPFGAVSLWYGHMPQCSDEEVRGLLERAWQGQACNTPTPLPSPDRPQECRAKPAPPQ